ncbi:MAG: hypothetical protein ACFFCW_41200 [Candidatus Hodarchaeota archaeon]
MENEQKIGGKRKLRICITGARMSPRKGIIPEGASGKDIHTIRVGGPNEIIVTIH